MNNKTLHLVEAALFAALTFVATFIIEIPTPGTSGYIHPGDGFVILSGLILGPIWGAGAAAVGSCLADILGGYFIYAPATFIIKGLVALLAGLIFKKLSIKKLPVRLILSSLVAVIIVPGCYLAFELVLYGASAVASVPANLLQAGFGVVFAVILYPAIKAIKNRVISE